MSATIEHRAGSLEIPSNWKKEEWVYTGGHLFDAYLEGKQDGMNEKVKILTRQFKENIDLAASVSEKLFAEADKKQIRFKSMHVKADDITSFSVLCIADANDYLSDEFRDIFITARRLKKEVENDSFYVSFLIMPESKEIDDKCISADGYFLKYEKK